MLRKATNAKIGWLQQAQWEKEMYTPYYRANN